MIKNIIDITPNRRFSSFKIKDIKKLDYISDYELMKNDEDFFVYNKGLDRLYIEENGSIYLEKQAESQDSFDLYNIIVEIKSIIKVLNPLYKNLLTDDTFYVYWNTGYCPKDDMSLDEYNIRNYKISEDEYTSKIHRKVI